MSDYDDDYGYDDYDDYDSVYDNIGYDYDSSDNEGDDDHDNEAHDHEGHDAGEEAVAEEGTIGFAVLEDLEVEHDHCSAVDDGGHVGYKGFLDYASSDNDYKSAVDGGGHVEYNGFFDYANSDNEYPSDGNDQVPYYGVISPGPSYVRDRGDHPALYSPSPYAPSARSDVEHHPSSNGT